MDKPLTMRGSNSPNVDVVASSSPVQVTLGGPHPGILRSPVINDPAYAPGTPPTDAVRPAARRSAVPERSPAVRQVLRAQLPPGTRPHERRWRDAPIILVERRKGPVWQYGSIAVCVALWCQVWLMYRA